MAYLAQSSLLGSVRLQQHLLDRTSKTTPFKFGSYMLPSIITTNEPIDRNPGSFANRHYPNAVDYSDPFARPPLWRKQVMLPYPPPPGFIERKSYGISSLDYQTVRRTMREQAEEAAAEERSTIFHRQQEEQRVETEKAAEAQRVTKIRYAVNKLNMGSPLTVEDRFLLEEDAQMLEKKKLEKELAGPAGAEVEAKTAAVAATAAEAASDESADDESTDDESAFDETASDETDELPPARAETIEYDPDEPPAHLGARIHPHRRHSSHGPRKTPSQLLLEIVMLLIVTLPSFLRPLCHNLSCPDDFRYCPCGIVKRPYRFLEMNPHLPFAVAVLTVACYWEPLVDFVGAAVWYVLRLGAWTVLGLVVVTLWPNDGRK